MMLSIAIPTVNLGRDHLTGGFHHSMILVAHHGSSGRAQNVRSNIVAKSDDEPTSFTPVGNSADSPEPVLRSSPAISHEAEISDV